jgi:hypothetical protein
MGASSAGETMTRGIAAILCFSLLCSGCATAAGGRIPAGPAASTQTADLALLASYVKQLPIGSRVRVGLIGGTRINGTLMKADDREIVVQPRTRIPEPPLRIAMDRIVAVELDRNGSNVGKTIGIGFGAGAGGALAVFLILLAVFSD